MANTRRQVSIFINGREAENTLKSIYSEKRKITAELNRMIVGSREYNDKMAELRKVNGIITQHRTELRSVGKSYDALQAGLGRFVGFAAGAFTADAIVSYGRELFKLGSEMEVLSKKAKIVFGEALPLVTAEANKNATAMGLTTSAYTDQAAAIGDLLVPMGFQREEAAGISTELVNLSGALSEWTGGQRSAEEVSKTLSKALLGEREELKGLGIAISEADVKARLAEKGLDKLTGKLLEQAKATATLELIMEKSVDAQTAFADNSDTLVRRQAEVSAKISEVSEKLSTVLFPVFERLVDIADDFASGLVNMADSLDALVNPSKAATEAFDDQAAKVNQLEAELVPLLDRYEELKGKSELSKEEQEELAKIIGRIADITPSAITKVDEYGRVLEINATASREFLEAERARLQFVGREAIEQTEKQIEQMKRQQAELQKIVETGKELRNLGSGGVGGRAVIAEVKVTDEERQKARENLRKTTELLLGAEAELARLRGDNFKQQQEESQSASEEDLLKEEAKQQELEKVRKEAAEKAAKERKRQAEQQAKELESQLEHLLEITKDFAEKEFLARQSEDDRELEQIMLKYDEQIQLAKNLEAAGVKEASAERLKLEQLKFDELSRVQAEQEQKRLEERQKQIDAEIEQEIQGELDKAVKLEEARQHLKDFSDEILLSEREQAIQSLDEQFNSLLALAKEYGLNVEDITRAYREKVAAINAEHDQKDKEQLQTSIAERAQALAQGFGAIGNTIGDLIDLVGDKSQEAAEFSRLLAVAQIATKTAEAIATGIAAATAAGPFPLNLAAIATTVATVLANIAAAKKLLQEEPVPQRAEGGYYDVRGKNDGRRYRAKYVGRPRTGMLPNQPVLLASEHGPEYFVANDDLRNPAVLNYVRAIENIRLARLGRLPSAAQYEEGGFTAGTGAIPQPAAAAPAFSADLIRELIDINRLVAETMLAIQRDGIDARIDDDTIVDLNSRYRKISDASGGVL